MTAHDADDADEIRPGDLVILPYPRIREQLGCGEEVGLVLEDRRHVLKCFLPEMGRVFWLERDVLQRVDLGRLAADPRVERLHRVGRLVHVDLIDLQDGSFDAGIIHLYSRGMRWEDAVAARELLGDDVRALRIEPANMRRIRLRIEMRDAPVPLEGDDVDGDEYSDDDP